MQKKFERILQALNVELVTIKHAHLLHPYITKEEKITHNRLLYVHKEKIIIKVNEKTYSLAPGELFFISSGTTFTMTYRAPSAADPISAVVPTYAPEPIHYFDYKEAPAAMEKHFSYIDFDTQAYGAIDFFQFIGLPPFIIKNNSKIKQYLKMLFHEISHYEIGHALLVQGSLLQILAYIIRYIISPEPTSNLAEKLLVKIDALMDLRLLKIFKYISDHVDDNLTNTKIATQVGLNKAYVGYFFAKHTHMNLQTYIQIVRLNKALEMLRTTKLKVRDISKAVGFSNGAYFGKQFRVFFGKTPKQLQKRYITHL